MGSRLRQIGKKLLVAVGLWLFIAVAALASFWVIPRTKTGWIVAVVLGPVFFIASEVLGEMIGWLFNRLPGIRHATNAVETRTRGQAFSGERVFTYLMVSLVWVIPLIALAIWTHGRGDSSRSNVIWDWLQRHFH
jgi:hypothetical protein